MLISDTIARLIEEMLSEQGGTLDIRRNDLAGRIGCAPSQINYVITSRFTPERGYIIESRRGGGGYIRIVKKQLARDEYLMHCFFSVGDELDEGSALAILQNLLDNGAADPLQVRLSSAAIGQAALARIPAGEKKAVRADIFRQLLLAMMK